MITVGSTDVPSLEEARHLEVEQPGPLATIQDLGRPGLGALGVGASGACDRASLRLANRLLGNPESAAGIEATAGGLVVRAGCALVVAVTGAPLQVTVDDHDEPMYAPVGMEPGSVLRLGVPSSGLRTYVAIRGGIEVPPTLGSRATDVLAGLGPRPLRAGARLPIGVAAPGWAPVDLAPVEIASADPLWLRVRLGPRDDLFAAAAITALQTGMYEVTPESNRVGLRLRGPRLDTLDRTELPSEGLVPGALQVMPSGLPTLLLPDHPVTGGYPVIAVVVRADLDLAGQARPGQRLRFRIAHLG